MNNICNSAYHGNGSSMVELSSYSFRKPGYDGKADHVHLVRAIFEIYDDLLIFISV